MRAAYLIHQQHEDKAEDKGYTNVGMQPGMVMAILMYNRDFCYLLRLNHMLHLTRRVMLPCGRQANRLGDRELNMALSLFSSFADSIPRAFLDNTQKSLFNVLDHFIREAHICLVGLSSYTFSVEKQRKR